MKRLTYILALLLGSLGVMAQTNQPLPAGSKPLSNILYLAPDSTVWTGDEFNGGLFVDLAKSRAVDSAILTRQKAFALNVQDFGAVGDSSTINTQAFYNAFNHATANGFRYIYVPTGTYLVDSLITIPKGISVFGDGKESYIKPSVSDIDHFSIPIPPAAGGEEFKSVVFSAGEATFIDELESPLAKGATYIITTDAASFAKNDVLKVIDTTAYSYSGYRPNYLEGEYFVIWRVTGDTIWLDHPVSNGFVNPAKTLMYRVELSESNINSIRIGGLEGYFPTTCLYMEYAGNLTLENVFFDNSRYSNVSIADGFNVAINKIYSLQTDSVGVGEALTQYGIDLIGCQNFTVTNSYLFARRHGFTTNSSTTFPRVVSRFGFVYGNTIYSSADHNQAFAADLHGASEHINFFNNTMTGIQIRGKSHIIDGNTILAFNRSTIERYSVRFAEIKQLDFTVTNNRIYTNDQFININLQSSSTGTIPTYNSDPGGIVKISGNTMESLNSDSSTASNRAITTVFSRSLTTNLGSSIDISNNTINCRNKIPQTVRIESQLTGTLGNVTISNNILKGANVYVARHPFSVISGNSFYDMPGGIIHNQEVTTSVITGNTANNVGAYILPGASDYAKALIGIAGSVGAYLSENTLNGIVGGLVHSVYAPFTSNITFGMNDFKTLSATLGGSKGASLRHIQLSVLNTPPASATAPGTAGEIRFGTDGRIYICTGTNTWIRTPAATTW